MVRNDPTTIFCCWRQQDVNHVELCDTVMCDRENPGKLPSSQHQPAPALSPTSLPAFLACLLRSTRHLHMSTHATNHISHAICHLLCYCFLLCWRLLPFPCCKVVRYCVASIAIISYKVGLSDCPFMFVCVCVHGG